MLDNRANVSKETVGLVKISGNNINVFEINADGTSFPTQITFNNIVVPNFQNTIVSRNARIRYQLLIQCDQSAGNATSPYFPSVTPSIPAGGTPATNVLFGQINAVLRAFPLQTVCNNVQVIINGATTTLNAQQCLPALQRTLPEDWIKKQATECPSQADNAAGYNYALDYNFVYGGTGAGAAGAVATATVPVGAGVSNQVFSNYFNSDGTNRGSFVATNVANLGGNNATYAFDISESILMSPFTIYDDEVWLSNINTMSLMFNYANLNDMVLFANPNVVNANNANWKITISNPTLELSYMQLSPDLVSIPRVTTLPYENVIYFPKAIQNGANVNLSIAYNSQISSDTLRLSSLPEKIYIFCRPAIGSRPTGVAPSAWADAFLAVGNNNFSIANAGTQTDLAGLQVSIGTRTGLLASASIKTIYRMAKKNGYRGSFQNWWLNGGLIILDPVTDLGVDVNAGDVLPGESGSINFQVNATFNNSNILYCGGAYNNNVPLEMMVVVVYSGTANITPDGCVFNTGELTHSEVNALLRTAPKDGSMNSTEAFKPSIHAGSLFSKFKSVLGTVANGLKSDAGQKALGMASDYLNKKGGLLTMA
jgi:hypothetical protein